MERDTMHPSISDILRTMVIVVVLGSAAYANYRRWRRILRS
jgi:hypothetical protein